MHGSRLKTANALYSIRKNDTRARRRDLVRALNRRNLVLDRFTRNHLSYQLHCPFHPPSLPHPTTLHTLLSLSPYQTEHINRFGRYALNRDRVPEPMDRVRVLRMPPRSEGLSGKRLKRV
jgi:hypothetical protein